MTAFQNETIEEPFELFYEDEFGRSYFSTKYRTGLTEARDSYIPIDNFKALFENNMKMVDQHDLKHFIFDKRSLSTFDQPSMEWYFVEWKKNLIDRSLLNHYKILPPLDWFKHSVQAGRDQIEKKYDTSFLEKIEITYMESVGDCLVKIGKADH